MAPEEVATGSSVFRGLFQVGIYKRTQGKVARQLTFGALMVLTLFGAYRLIDLLAAYPPHWRYGIPAVVVVVAAWVSFRIVNMPRFADFLIAVEAEMSKVSWPGRTELIRSVLVVLVTLIALTAILFAYDAIWSGLFRMIGIRA